MQYGSIENRIEMRSMENKHRPYGLYEKYFKRLLDILCGLAAVIVFWWLYIVLIMLGIIFMRGNPFFTQERPGKNEKSRIGFKRHYFRTSAHLPKKSCVRKGHGTSCVLLHSIPRAKCGTKAERVWNKHSASVRSKVRFAPLPENS